jgi:hypothetical protein
VKLHGPKREEETGNCREVSNEELHNLFSSPENIIEMR